MVSKYKTPNKSYLLKTDKFICNRFGLAEFFTQYYSEFECERGQLVLDAGCGALPLGIFFADQFQCKVIGVELNPIACQCAEYNIIKNSLSDRIEVFNEDFVTFSKRYEGEKFDLIVANPPVNDKITKEDVLRYSDFTYEKLDDKSFSFLTNSWHSAEGKDLIDYIFEFGMTGLKADGRIIIVFCTIDCDSPKYVYNKAEKNGYRIMRVVDGYVSSSSIGAETLGIMDINTIMVEFRRR